MGRATPVEALARAQEVEGLGGPEQGPGGQRSVQGTTWETWEVQEGHATTLGCHRHPSLPPPPRGRRRRSLDRLS